MGQVASFLTRRKLSAMELAEARERVGPDAFNDDELHHLYGEFTVACGSNAGRLNKKSFQQYVTHLKVFRRASKDEQFDPLFRAFDRGHRGDHITWPDFLDYHTAMKFGHPSASGQPGVAVTSGEASPPSADGVPAITPLSADINASFGGGNFSVTVGPGVVDLEDDEIEHEVGPDGQPTAAAYARRHRRLLGEVMFDMLVPDATRDTVSRQDMSRVLKRTVRWVTDEEDVRDDIIDAHVAALFKEARVPRLQNAVSKTAFVHAFIRHRRFATHLTALV